MTDSLRSSSNDTLASASWLQQSPAEMVAAFRNFRWKRSATDLQSDLASDDATALANLFRKQWKSLGPGKAKRKQAAWRSHAELLRTQLKATLVETHPEIVTPWADLLDRAVTDSVEVSRNGEAAALATTAAAVADQFARTPLLMVDCDPEDQLGAALQAMAAVDVLLLSGGHLPDETLLTLQWGLLRDATTLQQLGDWPDADDEAAASRKRLLGELSCLLGSVFTDLSGMRDLSRLGRSMLASELDAVTDSDGTPHGRMLNVFPQLLATFARHAIICEQTEQKFLPGKSEERYRQLLERGCALTDDSGQLALSACSPEQWIPVLQTAVGMLPDWKKQAWARSALAALPGDDETASKAADKRGFAEEESAATHTEWGEVTCLRNNWYPGSDRLAVLHGRADMQLELNVLSTPMLRGVWKTQIQMNNQPVSLSDNWAVMCWHNVDSCDYLELQQRVDDLILERQLLLSRNDHLALMIDTVKTEADTPLSLQWTLPLTGAWRARPANDERHLVFQKPGPLRVLPLALPQERVHKADGELTADDQAIHASISGQRAICLPVMFDWSPERRGKFCQWNRLTVTEERRVLTPQETFASRIRIGKHQWMLLRNLQHSGKPRAVLGQHITPETLFADFHRTGEVDKLLEVHYGEE